MVGSSGKRERKRAVKTITTRMLNDTKKRSRYRGNWIQTVVTSLERPRGL